MIFERDLCHVGQVLLLDFDLRLLLELFRRHAAKVAAAVEHAGGNFRIGVITNRNSRLLDKQDVIFPFACQDDQNRDRAPAHEDDTWYELSVNKSIGIELDEAHLRSKHVDALHCYVFDHDRLRGVS